MTFETITVGNVLTILSMLAMVGLYIIDTRYSTKGVRAEVREISKKLTGISDKLLEHMDDDTQRFEAIRKEVGETIAALRTKVTEVELFSRDHFVLRDDFRQALSEYQQTVVGNFQDMKAWMGRMEDRLNRGEWPKDRIR